MGLAPKTNLLKSELKPPDRLFFNSLRENQRLKELTFEHIRTTTDNYYVLKAMEPVAKLIPQEERGRYGLRQVTILASTNPNVTHSGGPYTHRPNRFFGVCGNTDFYLTWNAGLGQTIVNAIAIAFESMSIRGNMQVIRTGFDQETANNPITLLLSVIDDRESLPFETNLLSLLKDVNDNVNTAWAGERIYIDICQVFPRNNAPGGIDLCPTGHLASLYGRGLPPYLGSSVGFNGTLTAYIKHQLENTTTGEIESTPYALTCHHCVVPSTGIVTALGNAVRSPSQADTDVTLEVLSSKAESYEDENLKETLKRVQAYNNVLGFVDSTGGQELGFRDWALIRLREPVPSHKMNSLNQHLPYVSWEAGSGFDMKEGPGFDMDFIKTARVHYQYGPKLKPIRQQPLVIHDFYLKTPSRSLKSWVSCQLNGIGQHNFSGDSRKPSEPVLCFVSPNAGEAVTLAGDSGSLILDREGQPAAMIWGGIEMQATTPDITGASRIQEVFRNIEETMGWEDGSVSFC